MNNPATWVAVGVVVLGLVIFYLGITDSRWLPGGRAARQRESDRDFAHNVREVMGDTPEGRMRKAMERHTDVLERWLRQQSKD